MTRLTRRYSKKNALALARLAGVAYNKQNRSRVEGKLAKEHRLSLVTFLDNKRTDTQGYIAESPRTIVIAFRGTESAKDMITDIRVAQTRPPYIKAKCGVHRGVNRGYNSVRTRVKSTIKKLLGQKKRPVFITGHSLGGGLATLCAISLAREARVAELTVYTFGSPRVGDRRFARLYNHTVPNTYRVRNHKDVITTVPVLGYKHVGARKTYSSKGRLLKKDPSGASISDHKLARYIEILGG